MVLKIVRYLAQQGYKTENMVVLTPYLGQLSKLKRELQNETDPVLNDLDAHDLIAAGFMTTGAAKTQKKPLRLATIGKPVSLCEQLACILTSIRQLSG
jgi:hypothetical protein